LVETCQAQSAPCADDATLFLCNEAADCPPGQACCYAAYAKHATYSCQTLVGGSCPGAPRAAAQACRSSNECPTGECGFWYCGGIVVEACNNPNPGEYGCVLTHPDGG
jgi:hypothetical protein